MKTETEKLTCIDLFSGLGGFSQAFQDSDRWEVITVELEEDFNPDIVADIMELRPRDLPNPDLVLASPPCTYFSNAGNHDSWNFETHEPITDEARDMVTLVYHTIGLIKALSPRYWFLENPQGRLRWFLGRPTGHVTYCQYGRSYMKPTDLWGDHPHMVYKSCSKGESCHKRNRSDDGTSAVDPIGDNAAERSKVPYDLSKSILNAVETAIERTSGDQSTLSEL